MSLELEEQYDKIYSYCYFKVKNKEIAEDLTQDTFLKYFSSNSYINFGKPLAYLYIIAKNNCIDYFRKNKDIPLNEDIFLSNDINGIETNIVIKQAIEKLSKENQEILFLRFYNDLGVLEIAKILNISRFAVYRKIKSILKELKNNLKEEDFIE